MLRIRERSIRHIGCFYLMTTISSREYDRRGALPEGAARGMVLVELGRRQFLRIAGVVGALVTVPQVAFQATARAATRLSGADYAPKFTKALGRPPKIVLTPKAPSVTIDMTQFTQQVLTGYPATRLYGYGKAGSKGSWPGPTLHATSKKAVKVLWRNKLPKGSVKLANGGHLLPVDASLLDAAMTALPAGAKPVVPHLHAAACGARPPTPSTTARSAAPCGTTTTPTASPG
jgi:hypothetical protein